METEASGEAAVTGLRLLADIGGTKARFALAQPGQEPRDVMVLRNRDHDSLAAAAQAYLAMVDHPGPVEAAFSVACPISGDRVALTNFGWAFSVEAMREELGLARLEVVNDFSAVALSVPYLGAGDVRQIGGGHAAEKSVIGVIGAGTGLGVSGLVPANGGWTALASEGGHVTLAACNDREAAVLAAMRRRFDGHVSAERALSGPGLVNLYEALCNVDGKIAETLAPDEVSTRAIGMGDAACEEAVLIFSGLLGNVAADLALTLGAFGGIYMAGGVIHNMADAFDGDVFRARFEAKGRMRRFVTPIATLLITRQWPAFLGLAAVLDRIGA
ncbi:MAG: glucokinase [Alphaproteobacteria bacterium]